MKHNGLPGVKIVGHLTPEQMHLIVKEPVNLRDEELRQGHQRLEELFPLEDEANEMYWEEQKRNFVWLQEMYAKGYTYDELFND